MPRGDGRCWPASPQSRENARKFYYHPATGGNPMRRMTATEVTVDQHRSPEELVLLREWAQRLSGCFSSLSELRQFIEEHFDPCKSGFIGLGDFLCLWFKRRPLSARRSYAQQLGVMGLSPPAPPSHQLTVLVAAVAAAMGSHTLQRDFQRTAADTRFAPANFTGCARELADDGVWYGGWSWRQRAAAAVAQEPPPEEPAQDAQLSRMLQDPDARRHEQDGGQIYFTPFLLFKLRSLFEKYDENDGSTPGDATAHIRFGMVSSFLHEVGRDTDVGPFFALTAGDMASFLNDLVRHANDSMRDLRESALEARQVAGAEAAAAATPSADAPAEHEVLAGMLERARLCLQNRRPRQARREAELILQRLRRRDAAPPPYFEEPAFNFCNVLALLLKYMVAAGQADEVLSFFNDGITLFHSLTGQAAPRHGHEAVRPRVLPIRVLLRELAHLELGHPASTAFSGDAGWACHAGPGPDDDRVPRRRKVPAGDTLGAAF